MKVVTKIDARIIAKVVAKVFTKAMTKKSLIIFSAYDLVGCRDLWSVWSRSLCWWGGYGEKFPSPSSPVCVL